MADAIEYGVFAGGYGPPQYQRQRFAGIKNPEVFTGKDFGIWRRRRDLNPPLAGEPLRPLGYFCMPNTGYIWKKCGGESGIRTHGCFHIAGFQDRFLQPLGHLSTSGLRPNAKKMIPHFSHIVNCRLQYFSAFFPNSALTWSGVQVIKSNKQREPARRKEQMTL